MILMLRLILGWAMIGVGAVILPTPVPIGLIMVIVGLALVAPESKWLQGWLRRRRAAYPDFSARLIAWRPRLPGVARRVIDLTDPATTGGAAGESAGPAGAAAAGGTDAWGEGAAAVGRDTATAEAGEPRAGDGR